MHLAHSYSCESITLKSCSRKWSVFDCILYDIITVVKSHIQPVCTFSQSYADIGKCFGHLSCKIIALGFIASNNKLKRSVQEQHKWGFSGFEEKNSFNSFPQMSGQFHIWISRVKIKIAPGDQKLLTWDVWFFQIKNWNCLCCGEITLWICNCPWRSILTCPNGTD